MKLGKTLVGLAEELSRQNETKRDFEVGSTRGISMEYNPDYTEGQEMFKMNMEVFPGGQDFPVLEKESFGIEETAHAQLASKNNIPKKYYDIMKNEGELLATNVNHWLHSKPQPRYIRTLDDNVRAFLSNKYRPLDNYDLAQQVLPTLHEAGIEIRSCEITPTHMYIKGVNFELQDDIKEGDTVAMGVEIKNSEVGASSLSIMPFVERLVCTNGMRINTTDGMRKYHKGSASMSGDDNWEVFSDKTKELTDASVWYQVRDMTKHILSEVTLKKITHQMKESTEKKIEKDPITAVETTCKKLNIFDAEKPDVLTHLIQGGDMSAWGMANAVTRTAQDSESYDRASELEAIGWKVVEMPHRDWQSIAVN